MSPQRLVTEARVLVRGTGQRLAGRDLAAAAGTLTYFAGIAVVPWLLLAAWSTTWLRGSAAAEARLLGLGVLVPPDMGARAPYDALVHAGTHVGLAGAVVLLFPASFYGEGIRRACLALAPAQDRWTGWRARLGLLPLAVVVGPLTWALLPLADALADLSPEGGGGGAGALLLRVVLGFTGLWLALSVPLAWVLRIVAPAPVGWGVAVLGGLAIGSFLAGFLHGFQLFLSIPIDVGLPFAGLGVVGGVVAVGLWLYVLHTVFLVGWAATQQLGAQLGGQRGGQRGGKPAGVPGA